MLVEFSLIPISGNTHASTEIAQALQIVADSGLPNQLNPAGTCIEGDWEEVMGVIRRCHEHLRTTNAHLVTTIKIEDKQDARDQLQHNVTSVLKKVGHAAAPPPHAGAAASPSSPINEDD